MIEWVISGVIFSGALVATLVSDVRKALLALWFVGLSIGALYLALNVEFLAVTQWIVSTIVGIASIFFAVMFGEYGVKDPRPLRKRIVAWAMGGMIGLAFAGIIWIGARRFDGVAMDLPAKEADLLSLGKVLVEDHILSLEVLALTLFLVLVGGGVISRPDREGGEK